ncbi:MAG: AbrB/MazE/SpoVT family DNA-binding domain-containing protein [Chloroflexi bacterium]|nr:AbrB/MazE/SpoVT family DNA-binding domain-containing protein [Chloroflexota bacterium]
MDRHRHFPKFYGSTTVSERGQIVIPAQAREELHLEQGVKLMIFGGLGGPGSKGLILMPAETVTEFLEKITERMTRFENALREISEQVDREE